MWRRRVDSPPGRLGTPCDVATDGMPWRVISAKACRALEGRRGLVRTCTLVLETVSSSRLITEMIAKCDLPGFVY